MKKRFEWLFDKRKNKSLLFIWKGMRILDTREFNGPMDESEKRTIEQHIKDEEWEESK